MRVLVLLAALACAGCRRAAPPAANAIPADTTAAVAIGPGYPARRARLRAFAGSAARPRRSARRGEGTGIGVEWKGVVAGGCRQSGAAACRIYRDRQGNRGGWPGGASGSRPAGTRRRRQSSPGPAGGDGGDSRRLAQGRQVAAFRESGRRRQPAAYGRIDHGDRAPGNTIEVEAVAQCVAIDRRQTWNSRCAPW